MGKARRLYDIRIKTILDINPFRRFLQQTLGEAAAHLRDLQRVGQPIVEVVSLAGRCHLSNPAETPELRSVENPVSVALKRVAKIFIDLISESLCPAVH